MPALPSSVLEPLWVQVAALLPTYQDTHPLGCHRPRVPDRVVFDKLIQLLGQGCRTLGRVDERLDRSPVGRGNPPAAGTAAP